MKKTRISGKIRPFPESRLIAIAMSLPYQVMRLFTSPKGSLVEIKFGNRQSDKPESSHEWLWVTGQSVTSLQPLHKDDEMPEVRVFREVRLQFGDQRAELIWINGEQLALTAKPVLALPSMQHQLIHNHLS